MSAGPSQVIRTTPGSPPFSPPEQVDEPAAVAVPLVAAVPPPGPVGVDPLEQPAVSRSATMTNSGRCLLIDRQATTRSSRGNGPALGLSGLSASAGQCMGGC